MTAGDTLAQPEPPGGGVVIRGPWADLEPQGAETPPEVDAEHRAWLVDQDRRRRAARKVRRENGEASRLYQVIVLGIARARDGADLADVANGVLGMLDDLEPELLAEVIDQRLAGHRIR